MNREIKFRVFNGERMIHSKYLSIDYMLAHYNDVMQYTGLKDKNGKEIYEGDIIEYTIENDPMPRKRIGEVLYNKKRAVWQVFSHIRIDLGHTWLRVIIGNIYEDPELLNE